MELLWDWLPILGPLWPRAAARRDSQIWSEYRLLTGAAIAKRKETLQIVLNT
jgi:hypothetical protein